MERRMRIAPTFAVAGIIAFGSISALALSGTDLYQSCAAKKDSLGDLSCTAYIHGFLDGIAFGTQLGTVRLRREFPFIKVVSL
jgi:hypothetical protein